MEAFEFLRGVDVDFLKTVIKIKILPLHIYQILIFDIYVIDIRKIYDNLIMLPPPTPAGKGGLFYGYTFQFFTCGCVQSSRTLCMQMA